jgi:dihydroflavonol-4-reductase
LPTILVTGANGLLGSHIIRHLLLNDVKFDIIALVRENSDLSLLIPYLSKIRISNCSLFDICELEKLISTVDYIIHCAALVTFNAGNFNLLKKTNVEGTANLVNLALSTNIKKIVHISSVAALSKSKEIEYYQESSKWNHSAENSDYAISKYQSEQEVWRAMQEGLNATILNPPLILGSGNFQKTSLQIIDKIYSSRGFYPSGGNGFVDVNDVAQIAIKSLSNDYNGERFIVSGINLSYKELYEKIFKNHQAKQSYQIRPLPKTLSYILIVFTKYFEMITRKTCILSHQSIVGLSNYPKYDNSKSIKSFNFSYTPIDKTISSMLEGYFLYKGVK